MSSSGSKPVNGLGCRLFPRDAPRNVRTIRMRYAACRENLLRLIARLANPTNKPNVTTKPTMTFNGAWQMISRCVLGSWKTLAPNQTGNESSSPQALLSGRTSASRSRSADGRKLSCLVGVELNQARNGSRITLVTNDKNARKTTTNIAATTAKVFAPKNWYAGLRLVAVEVFFCPVADVSELLPSNTATKPEIPPIAASSLGNCNSNGGPNIVIALNSDQAIMPINIQDPKRPHHSRSSSSIHLNFETNPMNK